MILESEVKYWQGRHAILAERNAIQEESLKKQIEGIRKSEKDKILVDKFYFTDFPEVTEKEIAQIWLKEYWTGDMTNPTDYLRCEIARQQHIVWNNKEKQK